MRPTKNRKPNGGTFRWVRITVFSLVFTAGLMAIVWFTTTGSKAAIDGTMAVAEAKRSLANGQYAIAEGFATAVASDDRAFADSRIIAGEAAFRLGRIEDAVEYYQAVDSATTDVDQENRVLAKFSLGEIFRAQGRLTEAIDAYRFVQTTDPGFDEVNARLAFLLGITGQRWEAMPQFLSMIRDRSWTLDSLAILADLERPLEQPEFVAACENSEPHDPLVMMAAATQDLAEGDSASAQQILKRVVLLRPDIVAAHAMLGELLLAVDGDDIREWHQRLPDAAEKHCDIWFVRGVLLRGFGDLPAAAGCFIRAIEICPEHRRANYQLGQVLVALGDDRAGPFVERAEQQVELSKVLDEILASRGGSRDALKRAAELSEALGRYMEAWAWATTTSSIHPAETWPSQLATRVVPRLNNEIPRTFASSRLTDQADFKLYTERASKAAFYAALPSDENTEASAGRAIRFNKSASDVATFRYHTGGDPETPGVRMFEQTGGGVGVIDYDADGWPDLYFPQGNDWRTGQTVPESNPAWHDFLFRNLDGEQVREVALASGIEDLAYSQGVAVGDIDADGFDDLYVAAIGQNQLYRNNGDGTFENVTADHLPQLDQWTSSCAIVDLSGDGLADVFDVNYVQGDNVYTLICDGKGCSPKNFDGSVDQLLLGSTTGGFELIEGATPTNQSKGLGILAARFGDDPNLGLFISNDQVPNYFLKVARNPENKVQPLTLRDSALVSGLAYNMDGLAMACMGIAADDVDGNGLLDLLVTNFSDESNSLYLQDTSGLFVDGTRSSGMLRPSFPYVGWGTQFIDADLDGRSDCVVVNGHVDDYRDRGGMYAMPPQFYRNLGKGRFEASEPASVGDYFSTMSVSRALAKLDFNNDGLFDFAVSNIESPADLVINSTTDPGRYINLRLVGTKSAREPIGSLIRLKTATGEATKQLVGGDGYMASNQRVVQFGLGNEAEIEKLIVEWPSGLISMISNPPLDTTIWIIEAKGRAFTNAGQLLSVTENSDGL